MEQLVLGIFQEHLSKVIVGFRKEQVNANFLNGKGEIKNVELNCSILNQELSKMTPYAQAESVSVSKLSIKVESWTNLRQAPIHICLDHVQAVLSEPLHYAGEAAVAQQQIRQVTPTQLAQLLLQKDTTVTVPSSAYSLMDRIVDNLTIEIRSVKITFQCRGTFKTAASGPWTPPALRWELFGLKWTSVNEYGHEGEPSELWRHNHKRKDCFLIYKKLETEYRISLVVTTHEGVEQVIPIVSSWRDGGVRGATSSQQSKVEVQVAFKRRIRDGAYMAVQADVTIPLVEVEILQTTVPHLAHAATGLSSCLAKDRAFVDPLKSTATTITGGTPVLTTKSSDSDLVIVPAHAPSLADLEDGLSACSDDALQSDDDDEGAMKRTETPFQTMTGFGSREEERPLLILTSGTIIYEKVSMSMSIHHASIRGVYAEDSGRIQLEARGVVVECIWPKVTNEKGGHAQASISYISIHEQQLSRIRPLLIGGAKYENKGPAQSFGIPLRELSRDETFPLYEDRSVRPDPLGLRHLFPAQALGFKMTVGFNDINGDWENEEIMILNELGMDRVEVIADSNAWCRVLRFAAHVAGGGFDPRWESGDWSDVLTVDMLVRPNEPLRLVDHLQPISKIFLDENELLSSDLFNATLRMTHLKLRIPAAITEDIRSCDVVVEVEELVIVASSGLPRSLHREDKETLQFPHDPSDIAHSPNEESDSRASTFRAQLTNKGLSVRLVPAVPFNANPESRQLLAPTEMTMIFCLDGAVTTDNILQLCCMVSSTAQAFVINVDFDLLVSAASTVLIHTEKVTQTLDAIQEQSKATLSSHNRHKIEDTMEGRRILVNKQIERSRETGGVKFALWMKAASTRIAFWRHNVPRSSPLRSTEESTGEFAPVLRVMELFATAIDVGIEVSLAQENRHSCVRLCVGETRLSLVAFRDMLCDDNAWHRHFEERTCDAVTIQNDMVTIFAIKESDSGDAKFVVRLEEDTHVQNAYSFAGELTNGMIDVLFDDVETAILLILEALFLPVWGAHGQSSTGLFPKSTVGAFLSGLLLSPVDHASLQPPTELECSTDDVKPVLSAFIDTIMEFCDAFLLRMRMDNVAILIPSNVGSSCYRVEVEQMTLVASLGLLDTFAGVSLLNSVAVDTTTWKSLIPSYSGDHLIDLSSRQTLFQADKGEVIGQKLLGPFGASVTSKDSNISSTLSQIGTLADVLSAELFAASLDGCSEQLTQLSSNVKTVLRCALEDGRNGVGESASAKIATNPVAVACMSAVSSVDSVKTWFRKVNEHLVSSEEAAKAMLNHQAQRIEKLQSTVFSKEKERLAAISLCAADQRGWLRFGAPRRTGQRGLMTCSLWPHWVVVYRKLLFLYESPSQDVLVDVISLEGASIHNLNGGQNLRDLKRAAALVDRSGCIHFFTTTTDSEYLRWIHVLQTAAKMLGQNLVPDEKVTAETKSGLGDVARDSDKMHVNERYNGNIPVNRVDSVGSDNAFPYENSGKDLMSVGSADTTDLRGRFASVSQATKKGFDFTKQATKSRLGSAIQAAKQKGQEVAEKRLLVRQEGSSQTLQMSVEENGEVQGVIPHAENPEITTTSASSYWTCASCTFINTQSQGQCQMCETPRRADKSSSEGEPSDDENGSSLRRKNGMRQRLGAAVRRARSRTALQGLKPDPRLRNLQDGQLKVSQLRNVSVAPDPIGNLDHPLSTSNVETCEDLKLLEGAWSIRVFVARDEGGNSDKEANAEEFTSGKSKPRDVAQREATEEHIDAEDPPGQGDIVPQTESAIARNWRFRLQTLNHHSSTHVVVETTKGIADVLSFHVELSESTDRIPDSFFEGTDSQGFGTSAIDIVRASGRILNGLLQFKAFPVNDSVGERVDFINALIECPLPPDGLSLLTDFLTLPTASSRSFEPSKDDSGTKSAKRSLWEDDADRVYDLATLCEAELSRAANQVALAQDLSMSRAVNLAANIARPPGSTEPVSISAPFQDALQTTLVQTMEERDEAHARLIAAEVMHIHELEQKRKQVESLESQLAVSRQHAADNNPFASDKERKQFEALRRHDQDRQRDSDAELMSLCQQLAGEISSRTAANLEVIRMKESRKIERENERAQKQQLENELLQLRQDLARERQRSSLFRKESGTWRESFEEVVRIKETLSTPRSGRRRQNKSKSFDS